jgi:hypothetical protein
MKISKTKICIFGVAITKNKLPIIDQFTPNLYKNKLKVKTNQVNSKKAQFQK